MKKKKKPQHIEDTGFTLRKLKYLAKIDRFSTLFKIRLIKRQFIIKKRSSHNSNIWKLDTEQKEIG